MVGDILIAYIFQWIALLYLFVHFFIWMSRYRVPDFYPEPRLVFLFLFT